MSFTEFSKTRDGAGTMKQFTVRTNARSEMIDITDRIRILLKESRIKAASAMSLFRIPRQPLQ